MKIDQCLFGYDDGHRLLASSLPLGAETSLLTELSDLAPGTVFGRSEGYWTGLPVPTIGRYVLMRTWPAPEMPRPGCVWTHALLIEPSLLESISDLSALQNVVTRPDKSLNADRYRKPIDVDLSKYCQTDFVTDDAIVQKIIASLYETDSTTVEITSPGELDVPLFAVWSQQWPRLRRNFRFQTAASRGSRYSGTVRFDVTAILSQEKIPTLQSSIVPSFSWLSVAVQDAQKGSNGSLRSFLWCYGLDVRRQRGSFRPLVEISMLNSGIQTDSAKRMIEVVTNAFPTLDDALNLKQDLVDGLLLAHAQAKLIQFVVLHEGRSSSIFPPPTAMGIAKLKNLWPLKSDDILQLAEVSAGGDKPISKLVFESVINIIQTQEFWSLTRSYPNIRQLMIQRKPEIITKSTQNLDDTTLIELLPLVSTDTPGLREFITRLMPRDNQSIVNIAFDHFPDITATETISAVNDRTNNVANVWLEGLICRPQLLLKADVMGIISRSSLLYKFGESLGWLSPIVITAGTAPWNAALKNISQDILESQSDFLNCFLVVLAFKSGGPGGNNLIEILFDDLHNKILNSKLPQRAHDLLSSQLPEIGWLRRWDLGLRFRLAVATAYVRYEWPPESYVALAHDKKSRVLLAEAASDISGGYEYFKSVSQ
ncbi:hypothetical protein [Dickeya dadantii]|uniref:GAP1-N1 domain-containing protein n=1 Tax=Dickeya dadantii TaxID=204038 RepID=UPI001C0ADCBF|nr:hypothetical protein [Dickeya dadantii]QWT40908.1 hypothetical protein KNV89_21805 [Dickeya dadantii]